MLKIRVKMGKEEMFYFSRNFFHVTYPLGHNFSALGQKQNRKKKIYVPPYSTQSTYKLSTGEVRKAPDRL